MLKMIKFRMDIGFGGARYGYLPPFKYEKGGRKAEEETEAASLLATFSIGNRKVFRYCTVVLL